MLNFFKPHQIGLKRLKSIGSVRCCFCYLHVTCVTSPRTGRLNGILVTTIPSSDQVSTENGWESVLNHFRLKRLIALEHDSVTLRIRANNQRATFLTLNLAFLLTVLSPPPGVCHISRSKFNQDSHHSLSLTSRVILN